MKILTFNLRHNNDYWEARKPLVIDLINEHQPDIIGFQEVWMPIEQANLILNHVSGKPYTIYTTAKQAHHGTEGIAIATRYPSSDFESLDLPGGERVAQRAIITLNGQSFCFANTHLHHKPFYSEEERLPQMQALLQWLDDVPHPVIFTGDMNTTPDSETILSAKDKYVSAYEQAEGQEPDFTYPAPIVVGEFERGPVMIDYIFISPDTLRATSAYIVGDEAHGTDPVLSASDHLGIIAEVNFI